LAKRNRRSPGRRDPNEPDYGVAKERLPKDWIHTRETMQRRGFSMFHVRKWYFPFLVVAALIVFAASLLTWSLGLALVSAALTLTLYYWNQHEGAMKRKNLDRRSPDTRHGGTQDDNNRPSS
jgi:hypothetical protein